MPIDIKIEGDPESIRSAGRWLRSSLSGGVEDCTTQVYRVRGDSEGGWQGEAGNAFRGKMTSGGKSADELVRVDLERLAGPVGVGGEWAWSRASPAVLSSGTAQKSSTTPGLEDLGVGHLQPAVQCDLPGPFHAGLGRLQPARQCNEQDRGRDKGRGQRHCGRCEEGVGLDLLARTFRASVCGGH